MRPLSQSLDLPIQLLLDAMVAERPLDWRPGELETLLVTAADTHRAGATYREVEALLAPAQGELVLDGGEFRLPAVGEPADLRFEIARGTFGTFIRGFPIADRQPIGRTFAPVAAAFWRWADRSYSLGLGPLEPAADLRR